MNIFVTDVDPIQAALNQCNKHVVKMVTESAQLLTTCFPSGMLRFRYTHVNHPCAVWARASLSNYKWLLVHANALAEEYTRRYGRIHASSDVIDECLGVSPDIEDVGLTPFARCIKEPWKAQTIHLPIVDAYRHYYINDKARFAKWAPKADPPSWWPFKEEVK